MDISLPMVYKAMSTMHLNEVLEAINTARVLSNKFPGESEEAIFYSNLAIAMTRAVIIVYDKEHMKFNTANMRL